MSSSGHLGKIQNGRQIASFAIGIVETQYWCQNLHSQGQEIRKTGPQNEKFITNDLHWRPYGADSHFHHQTLIRIIVPSDII